MCSCTHVSLELSHELVSHAPGSDAIHRLIFAVVFVVLRLHQYQANRLPSQQVVADNSASRNDLFYVTECDVHR